MDAQFISTDGTYKTIKPANGSDFTLEELYNLIGCDLIEVVSLDGDKIMIVDEEGLLKGSRINHEASAICLAHIVGNAVFCPSDMLK